MGPCCVGDNYLIPSVCNEESNWHEFIGLVWVTFIKTVIYGLNVICVLL